MSRAPYKTNSSRSFKLRKLALALAATVAATSVSLFVGLALSRSPLQAWSRVKSAAVETGHQIRLAHTAPGNALVRAHSDLSVLAQNGTAGWKGFGDWIVSETMAAGKTSLAGTNLALVRFASGVKLAAKPWGAVFVQTGRVWQDFAGWTGTQTLALAGNINSGVAVLDKTCNRALLAWGQAGINSIDKLSAWQSQQVAKAVFKERQFASGVFQRKTALNAKLAKAARSSQGSIAGLSAHLGDVGLALAERLQTFYGKATEQLATLEFMALGQQRRPSMFAVARHHKVIESGGDLFAPSPSPSQPDCPDCLAIGGDSHQLGQVLAAQTAKATVSNAPAAVRSAAVSMSDIKALVTQTFQSMLAQGRLTGPMGPAGPQGPPGLTSSGLVNNGNGQSTAVVGGMPIVSYLPANPTNNFNGASLAGFTDLSAGTLTSGNTTINGNLNVSGANTITSSLSVSGATTLATATVSSLTVSGNTTLTGTATLSSATTSINGVTYFWPASLPVSNRILQSDINGNLSWVTDAGGGATTTITTNIQSNGPNFTFATSSATGLNLNITGSSTTITFAPQLQAGYTIPLSASTTEWGNFYASPPTRITAGAGLLWSGNTLSASSTQNIAKLSNLTGNGFVKTINNDGTLSIDTNTYLTGNQTITLSGAVSGSGTTAISVSFASTTPVGYGGTGTSTAPTQTGQLLAADGTGSRYAPATLINGANIIVTTSTAGSITIAATGLQPAGSYVTSVAGSGAVTSTGGTTAVIGITTGDLSLGANLSLTSGDGKQILIGTSTQISLGANVITSIATSSTGSGFYISTSTNSLTINIPNSNASVTGLLQGTDWTTFNNKLSGSGTNNYLVKFSGPSTTVNSLLYDDGTYLSINSTTATALLTVQGSSTLPTTNIFTVASSSNSQILTVTAAGRVGIGTTTPGAGLDIQGTLASSSGTDYGMKLQPTVNASGTEGYTALLVNVTQTTTGSGAKLLEDLQVAGSSKFSVDNGGLVKASIFQPSTNFRAGANGSAALAAYDFSVNTNGLGMFRAGTDLLAFTTASTERLRIDATGNVGIGTTTPATRLGITGTPAIDPFDISSTSGVSLLRFTQGGNLGIGSTSPSVALSLNGGAATDAAHGINFGDATANLYRSAAGTLKMDSALTLGGTLTLPGSNIISNTGSIFTLSGNVTNSFANQTIILLNGVSGTLNPTSGTDKAVSIQSGTTFGPTSGTANYHLLDLGATINQNPVATGITRGLYLNPTLTNAYDFRGLETAAYTATTNQTTLLNNILFNQPSYASSGAATLTNAQNIRIAGAPIATYNMTISSSTALTIAGGSVLGAGGAGFGTTTNAYGLFLTAPTGASNNYAAIFTGGNVGIGTSTPTLGPLVMGSGAYVTSGGTWTNASDRNLKENFATMTPADILQKIDQLPITEWNYKNEGPNIKHIGPVAQDFYALFQVGNSSSSISTIDPAGIALLGIQALDQKIVALQGVLTGNATTSVLTVYSPANFSGDSVGQAEILSGATSVRVNFSQPYQYQPIVVVTPIDFDGKWKLTNINNQGFTIWRSDPDLSQAITFNWHSFASPNEQLTVSSGTTSPITLVVATSTPANSSLDTAAITTASATQYNYVMGPSGWVLANPTATDTISTDSGSSGTSASSASSTPSGSVLGTSTTTASSASGSNSADSTTTAASPVVSSDPTSAPAAPSSTQTTTNTPAEIPSPTTQPASSPAAPAPAAAVAPTTAASNSSASAH